MFNTYLNDNNIGMTHSHDEPVKDVPDNNQPVNPVSELAQCRQQAEEYLNGWKRAKADYANLRKETDKQQMEFVKYANAALIHELLPLVGHFQEAFRHLPDDLKDSDWVKGIRHIQTNLDALLANCGVKEIPTVGEKFDPEQHEAVGTVKGDQPSGTIVEKVKPGFRMYEQVLQPAKVKVAE
jgi:molecular chaperone GrpE